MERNADEVRREVAKAYAEQVARSGGAGACGPRAAPGAYSIEELRAIPEEAAASSFGCGNPIAMAGLREGDVVVDLGSGAGIDLFVASTKVGPRGRVIGVEMTDEMIERARASARAGGYANVEVRKGIIEALPVESGSVDWVISNCVINLSPEKPRVFREIARVLRPGGRMLVSDIVAHDLPRELLDLPALYSSCVSGAISEEDYLAGLRAAGLVDVEVRDRLVYDADQLVAFAEDALKDGGGGCGCGAGLAPVLRGYAATMAGKVWSAKVFARKP